ncbi:MAG TPA: hypothetical protein VGT61_13460 [Thermomicrobiales bacterium]|jgi:hypothetical protein|nr:hypothetical protein [Thermomicrobiales bacterium]
MSTPPRDPRPSSPSDGGLFRKRPDAIGPAPLFFAVALGLTFGISIGLLIGQPIIGAIFGAMLGGLFAAIRQQGTRR